MIRAVTHNGRFHADDVFAYTVLSIVYKSIEVVRSRDEADFKNADIVFDVGGTYDPAHHRYDHHMKDAPKRKDGQPYSSIGLVWRDFGYEAIKSLIPETVEPEVVDCAWHEIDQGLILEIDQSDNGKAAMGPGFISALIEAFNPNWNDPPAFDQKFIAAKEFAYMVLAQSIRKSVAYAQAKPLIEKVILEHQGEKVVLFEHNLPWQTLLPDTTDTALYVIHPNEAGDAWYCHGVPVKAGTFAVRKPFPKSWRGLENEELVKATGIKDARFCHSKGFICSARTAEGARQLANSAIEDK